MQAFVEETGRAHLCDRAVSQNSIPVPSALHDCRKLSRICCCENAADRLMPVLLSSVASAAACGTSSATCSLHAAIYLSFRTV